MRRSVSLLVFVAMIGIAILYIHRASGQTAGEAGKSPTGAVYVKEIPKGYRDWRLISIAHEEGNLHSIGALLGNDTAYRAFRAGTLPYPEGSMLAALHYKDVLSEENDKVFGQEQSHVPGAATNVQFMVKDQKKYAATGGWGYGSFGTDGKSFTEAQMSTCFPCHQKATRDGVFSWYAP